MNSITQSKNLERRFLYNLLSDIFIVKPDIDFLKKIHREDIYDFLKKFSDSSQDIRDLEKYISLSIANNQSMIELASYFENTFLIPVARYYIPPYMSAFVNYRDLRSNSTFYTIGEELKSIYALYGLNFDNRSDHLSVIFSFMSYLINVELLEINVSAIGEQKNFFQRYIISWVENFFNEIFQRGENKFYKIFAIVCKNFINEENNLMQSLSL